MDRSLDEIKEIIENAAANSEPSPIEMLLDPDDSDPIMLYNEKGEPCKFDQVALIPLDEKLYVILSPVTPIPGVGENEGLVFSIEEIEDEDTLVLCADPEIIDRVFDVYEALLAEEE